MTTQYSEQDLCIRPGEGETTSTDMVIKARAAQMGGDFSVMEGFIEPHELLAPHTHAGEDQLVFVIEGELEFEVGGEGGLRFSAGPGSYVHKPRGLSHAFWNSKETTVRYIELSGRDGFERYVDSHEGGLVASTKTAKQIRMTFDYARIPKLMAQNGLTGLSAVELPSLSEIPEKLHGLIRRKPKA